MYDLETDPDEWHNLADDPDYAEIKSRLISALEKWRRETRDPFLDEDNLESFVAEQLANRDLGYRKARDFRWSYLDVFPKWRKAFTP